MAEVKNKGIKLKLGEEEKKVAERRGSTGNIEEMWKRKREKMEEGEWEKWGEEGWAFKEGKRVMRSPQKGVVEGEGGEGRWWKEIKED